MFTIPPIVITILEGILTILGAYLVVFWFGMVVWTWQDVRRRTRDWLVRIIALLLVLCFNVAGLIIYLIIRPQESLAEVQERSIEEEALMQDMEEKISCPACRKAAQPDFAVCPYCGERLKQSCASCQRLLNLNWTVCPYCENPVQKAEPVQLPQIVQPAVEPPVEPQEAQLPAASS
jgi:hypothetical protein